MRKLDFQWFASMVFVVGVIALFYAACMLWQAYTPENLDHTPNPPAREIYEKIPGNHFEPIEPSSP